ncbi:MAG TPA: HEAT repeat domain-containing protein [Gemmatimonadaceae bacterium]|nr:HEAT repeat domain-containing protein [Gemmatimonadaceae bacterium]
MDNSLTLARYFARLVWLLVNEGQAISDQKAALRAVVTVSKESSVRLRNREGRLAVNQLVMPQALTGVQELAARLAVHSIEEIEIDQSAAAAELLALARLLAVESTTSSDAADFAQRLSELANETVRVKRAAATEPAPARTAEPDAPKEPAAEEATDRVPRLLTRLTEQLNAVTAHEVLDEIAFVAEQATREGRTADVAETFAAMLDRESGITDPDVRRIFLVGVRRITKPVILRPIAGLLVSHPDTAARTERILQRVGQDGVDSVVDQYTASRSITERATYRAVLLRLPLAREALLQMLADPRWYVVRTAAEFLGELRAEEAERPLAELLSHEDERVRRAATRALSRIESTFTLDAVARSVVDASPSVRLEAVAGLATRKTGRAGSLLAKAIDTEEDQEVQYAILDALGRVATPEAVQKLSKSAEAAGGLFTSRKNIGLRVAAVYALGEAHTAGALTALQALAGDKDKDVKEAAAKTLLLLRGSAA